MNTQRYNSLALWLAAILNLKRDNESYLKPGCGFGCQSDQDKYILICMKVLVTGGAGYIGSVTGKLLSEVGYEVVVLDNLSQGHRSAVKRPIRLIVADLADAELVSKLLKQEKPAAVLHFAGLIAVEESIKNPAPYFYNNVACGINLLNACLQSGVRKLIFSSTAAVYGTPTQIPVTEDCPLAPVNPYGESKRIFEELLQAYARTEKLRFCSLRYFNVAGAYHDLGEDHRPETHLIPKLLRSVIEPDAVFTIHGNDYPTPDGTCIRDYIHIYDLARAHILALEALNDKNLIYNLGSEKGYSVKEVLATAEKVTGRKLNYRVGPRRAGDVPVLVASSEKIRNELGWYPTKTLTDMIADAWEWLQAHPEGYPD